MFTFYQMLMELIQCNTGENNPKFCIFGCQCYSQSSSSPTEGTKKQENPLTTMLSIPS